MLIIVCSCLVANEVTSAALYVHALALDVYLFTVITIYSTFVNTFVNPFVMH